MASLYLSNGINNVLQRHFATEYAQAVGLLRKHSERSVKPKFAELFGELLTNKLDQIDKSRQRIADDYQHNTNPNDRRRMKEQHAKLGEARTDIAQVIRELPKAQLKANVGFGSKLMSNFSRGKEAAGGKSVLGMAKDGLNKVKSDLVSPRARASFKNRAMRSLKNMLGLDKLSQYSDLHKRQFARSLNNAINGKHRH